VRTFDRVLSVLLALLLVTLGVLIPVEVVRGLAGADPLLPYSQVADFFRERSWSSGLIITISAIVAGLGLLLVLAELKRRRPTQIILSTDSEEVTVDISRRSLARAVANAATSTPGVSDASSVVKRRQVRVAATTPLRDPGTLAQQARQRAEATMESLAPVHPLPVRLRLTRERDKTVDRAS
jgi:hypothetical protein